MSVEDGWAALNLEKPSRIPHTEMSAEWYHCPLVKAVTGIDIDVDSPHDLRGRASHAFIKAWNYDIHMTFLVGSNIYGDKWTYMGHAEYADKGRDFEPGWDCPFKSVEEALALDPWETFGPLDRAEWTKRFNAGYEEEACHCPNLVAGTGIYTTIMSGMIAIFGWDMLLTMAGTDAEGFGEVCNRYAQWLMPCYEAMADSDAPLVWVHDDMVWTEGAFIHPEWYRRYVFPNFKKLWAPLVEADKKILFVCDGDYTQFAGDVADCGVTGFWFEVFTDLEYMVERFGQTHVLIGNGDCRPLTFGTKDDVRREVHRCMDLGRDCPGYFMCINGHMPSNIPVENALYYYDVYTELSRR
ncbi:MAG: uroporphyrinogen decarboxylase family protein [Planctomycetota bacterium]|jgi:uroporphyrinogen-III decarboxylase